MGNMYLIFLHDQIYHSGTPCSVIAASHSGFKPLPLRTDSIIVKESPSSMPRLIRYTMISSLVQIAVWIVAVPSEIRVCALPSHTSVPWESPAIRTRSEKYFGLVSINICMAKSVPNSGIPSAPSLHPPISSGVIFKAEVFWKRLITSLLSSGISCTGSIPVKSWSIRIMVGSSCPKISSFKRLWSMEW